MTLMAFPSDNSDQELTKKQHKAYVAGWSEQWLTKQTVCSVKIAKKFFLVSKELRIEHFIK